MDNETRKALHDSCSYWNRIVDGREICQGAEGCSLCKRFINNFDAYGAACEGCPIKDKTGREGCYDTPYIRYSEIRDRVSEDENLPTYHSLSDIKSKRNREEEKEAALAMMNFLANLIKEDEQRQEEEFQKFEPGMFVIARNHLSAENLLKCLPGQIIPEGTTVYLVEKVNSPSQTIDVKVIYPVGLRPHRQLQPSYYNQNTKMFLKVKPTGWEIKED